MFALVWVHTLIFRPNFNTQLPFTQPNNLSGTQVNVSRGAICGHDNRTRPGMDQRHGFTNLPQDKEGWLIFRW